MAPLLDDRRLFVPEGYSSAFAFLTEGLRLSEGVAFRRLKAARCSRKFPEVLDRVRAGKLNLSSLALVAKHLRPENVTKVLDEVAKLTHRGVEQYVAREFEEKLGAFSGQDTIRFYAERSAATAQTPPVPAVTSEPVTTVMIAPANAPANAMTTETAMKPSAPVSSARVRARVSFSANESLVQKIEEIRGLIGMSRGKGHRTPALEEVFEKLADEYLERHCKKRRDERAKARESVKNSATPTSPAPAARPENPPRREALRADVARKVRERDRCRCTFVSAEGVRCSETRVLEVDHAIPVALGGAVNDPENTRLRCRPHNAYAAIQTFGPEFMSRWVRPVGSSDASH